MTNKENNKNNPKQKYKKRMQNIKSPRQNRKVETQLQVKQTGTQTYPTISFKFKETQPSTTNTTPIKKTE